MAPWQDSINLPDDEGIHLAPVEWWYFNGHIEGPGGNQYSFHFVTFISITDDGEIPQLMQLSLADHDSGLYMTDEEPSLVNDIQTTQGNFVFDLAGWHMSGDGSEYQLAFDTNGYTLDLTAFSAKPPVFHQGNGLVDLGRAGETYYYSRTQLDVSGTLTRSAVQVQVSGRAWMDHQWGDFSTQPIGWDWYSLQLDDGSEVMISQVWDSANLEPITSYGTYVPARHEDDPAGLAPDPIHIPAAEISLASTASWISPANGVEYPSSWQLEVSSLGLVANLTPVQKSAEFYDSLYVPIAYWEGAVTVNGLKDGEIITGDGFVELVGYDRDQVVR
jgi:predicted secreted hydrolase